MSLIKKQIIRLLESCGAFRVLEWFNRRKPLILMYHRITDDPRVIGLAPNEFEKQIAYIARRFRIVPVETLLAEIEQDIVKPYTLAITFDDGHEDFYRYAWPILKKYQIPVSLYISTGFVDTTHWLWPDYLKYILLNTHRTEIHVSELGLLEIQGDAISRSWHQLGDYCLGLSVDDRNRFLVNLADNADVSMGPHPRPPFTAVTWSQLEEMQRDGLDIGSHTVSHPILGKLSDADIRYELRESANAIEAHLGKRPRGLCYPNGRPEDIDQRVIDCAQKLGYRYGLMGRNLPISKQQPFLVGRLAANINFRYFKWTLAHRPKSNGYHYIN